MDKNVAHRHPFLWAGALVAGLLGLASVAGAEPVTIKYILWDSAQQPTY